MYKIGLSTCDKPLDENLFAQYKSARICAMEVCLSNDEEYDSLDFLWLKNMAEKYGIMLNSLHLPFYPSDKLNLAVSELKEQTVEYYKKLILRAKKAGISLFVLHAAGGEPEKGERKEWLSNSKESLEKLASFAEENGITIALEPLPRGCIGNKSSEIEELISVHNGIKICLDTNHLQNERTVDFIYKFGDKIVTTHVSDFDFTNERHWLPGEGKQDFSGILKALSDVGYTGPWLYEVEFSCPPTILRDRALNCADIAKNADEVLNGKKITLISKPKPNLGMWR